MGRHTLGVGWPGTRAGDGVGGLRLDYRRRAGERVERAVGLVPASITW